MKKITVLLALLVFGLVLSASVSAIAAPPAPVTPPVVVTPTPPSPPKCDGDDHRGGKDFRGKDDRDGFGDCFKGIGAFLSVEFWKMCRLF